MHALNEKAGQRHLRCAEQLNATARAQPCQQLCMQGCLVFGDRLRIQAAQVIQSRAQADDAGDGR
ncbi:hypothetical protein AO269_26915, partial [Pseudomonas putida]